MTKLKELLESRWNDVDSDGPAIQACILMLEALEKIRNNNDQDESSSWAREIISQVEKMFGVGE